MRDVKRLIWVLTASLCMLFLMGCEDEGQISEEGSEVIWPEQKRDPGTYVCNPIVDPDDPSPPETPSNQGIVASLFYLAPDLPNYSAVDDYIEFGTKLDFDLFFNQINVPTRPFDRGFETVDGTTITTPEGDTLYEWMALQFEGTLQLNPDQAPGDYQMAVLSDDGSILEMDLDNDGTFETVVDNDGWHPTRLGCAPAVINFAADSQFKYRLKYFQGPRYHISVMLMMRPVPALPEDLDDPLCGRQGNSLFFDSRQSPPAPQTAFLDLQSRGWEVLSPENYLLASDQENPLQRAGAADRWIDLGHRDSRHGCGELDHRHRSDHTDSSHRGVNG